MANKNHRSRLLVFAAALALLASLGGCKESGIQEENNPPPKPPTEAAKPTETIELMPESSPESLRRHIIAPNGTKTDTHIQYRDGSRGHIKFRPNGTQSAFTRHDRDGKLAVDYTYGPDGSTIASGVELRANGTTIKKFETLQDGRIQATTFYYDGQTVYALEIQNRDGTFMRTRQRFSGTKWTVERGTLPNNVTRFEFYNRSGQLEHVRETTGTTTTYQLMRPNGTMSAKQTYSETRSQYGSRRTLKTVEEYADDGKTLTRTITMDPNGYNIAETRNYNRDGTTVVRKITQNGTVDTETILERDGSVRSRRTVPASEGMRETINYRTMYEPNNPDPDYNWRLQEQYPQYRGWEN